jgi:hypothetical protein
MQTTPRRRYAVAYLLRGKLSAIIHRRQTLRDATESACELNDFLQGSGLMAVVIPHPQKLKGGAR